MRLVTWNVAGRVRRQPEQAAVIAELAPDIVALQEVTATTAGPWREALARAGLPHAATPLDAGRPPKPRRLAVLTAAREPLDPRPAPAGLPWPERVQVVALAGGERVVNVHSPISPSPGLAKVLTHEALAAALAPPSDEPVILCGDLNTPRREHGPGDVLTFAHDTHGRVVEERGERWVAAERALVAGLLGHGYVDAYRELHGYGDRSASWTYPRGGGGYRLDHVLVRDLVPTAAAYAHVWREHGLSDHSALVVDLTPASLR